MNAVAEKNTTELTIAQRVELALGEHANAAKLRELAKSSLSIQSVTNNAGREEAHRAGMVLANTRVNITKVGKAAREDAQAFSKGVIAMEKSLISLIEPEEVRVLGLRDAYDAKVAAERQAKIDAELARTSKIADFIAAIREHETDVTRICTTAAETQEMIDILEKRVIDQALYQERTEEAKAIKAACLVVMHDVLAKRQAAEAEAARKAAEMKAEAERLEAERAALAKEREEAAALRAKQEAELAAEREANRLAAEANAKAAAELAEKVRISEKVIADRVQAEANAAKPAFDDLVPDFPAELKPRPTDEQIIQALCAAFGVDAPTVIGWKINIGN